MLGSPQEDHGLPACLQAVDGDNGPVYVHAGTKHAAHHTHCNACCRAFPQETDVFEKSHARSAEDEHDAHEDFQDMGRSVLQDEQAQKGTGDGAPKHEHGSLPATVAKVSEAHDKADRQTCETGDKHHSLHGHDGDLYGCRDSGGAYAAQAADKGGHKPGENRDEQGKIHAIP